MGSRYRKSNASAISRFADPARGFQGAAQFGGGEVGDLRGALPTRLHGALHPRQPVRIDRVTRVEIRPVRGQQQPGHLNLDRGVLVALHRREGGVLIEASHIVFEHTFTLERATDIDTGTSVSREL